MQAQRFSCIIATMKPTYGDVRSGLRNETRGSESGPAMTDEYPSRCSGWSSVSGGSSCPPLSLIQRRFSLSMAINSSATGLFWALSNVVNNDYEVWPAMAIHGRMGFQQGCRVPDLQGDGMKNWSPLLNFARCGLCDSCEQYSTFCGK